MNYNEEKKKGNGLLVVVIILLVVLIAVGSVLIYQNYQNKNNELQDVGTVDKIEDNTEDGNNDNNDKNEMIVKDLSLDSTIVRELSSVFYGKYSSGAVDDYGDYFYKNARIDVASLPYEFKIWMSLKKLNLPEFITEEQLKQEFFSIFGKKTNYLHLDEIGTCPLYKYNEFGNYTSASECGGTVCGGSISKLINAQEIVENDVKRVEIIEAVAFDSCEFSGSSDYISKFYKDYKYTEFVEEYDNRKNPLDEHPEKYAQYKYTFVDDNSGVYVFTSVERVK